MKRYLAILASLAILAPALVATQAAVDVPLDFVLPLALLGFGIFLILMEVTVIPGFGVAGLAGIALTGVGLYIGVRDVAASAMEMDPGNLGAITIGIIGAVAGSTLLTVGMFKVLPLMPGLNRMILNRVSEVESSTNEAEHAILVGQAGIAATDLRPAGKVTINGSTYDVTTTDGYVTAGEQVYVEKIHQGHPVVRRLA